MIAASNLLYGPQGCGKTLLASAVFNETQQSERSVVSIDTSDILENPQENLRRVFDAVERFQIFGILIEDIDGLFGNLRNHHPATHHYLLKQLKHTNNNRVIIATTRNPETLTPDELEAFSAILPILYPDKNGRLDILRVITKDVQLDLSVSLESIADITEWWSGGELKELIDRSLYIGQGVIDFQTLSDQINLLQQPCFAWMNQY